MHKNNHRWQLGDKVKKKANSSWRGVVCGFYNTAATPNGYSVVSLYETGSVQVWPEAALEDWDGVMVEDELRAEITRLTEALRAAEERERVLREALIKAEEPHWFYAEGHEERCLYSPDDAIDLLDFNAGEYVTEVATARPCRSIWCAVSVTDDENADERFTFTEHDSEEAARQALAGAKP